MNKKADLRRLTDELRAEKKRADMYFNAAAVILVVLDFEGKIVRINETGYKLLGYDSEDQLIGLSWFDFIPENIRQQVKRILQSCLSGDEMSEKIYSTVRNKVLIKDGRELTIDWYNTIIYDDQSKPIGTISSGLDVTDSISYESKITDMNQLKTRFIAALSHVVSSPLNKITWSLDSLVSGEHGNLTEEQEIFAREAVNSARDMSRIISYMNLTLDMERGNMILEKTSTSITSLIKAIKTQYDSVMKIRNIKWKDDIEKNLPSVMIDSNMMKLALEAVIDNAVRYTKPEGGDIQFIIKKTNGNLEIVIQDNGVGIPSSEIDNVSNRFFRASNSQIANSDGLGLGLYIAKNIIEKHNGSITFQSVENQGTSVTVIIPIKG